MTRVVLVIVLIAANAFGYISYTQPSSLRHQELQEGLEQMERARVSRLAEEKQLKELHDLVQVAQSTIDPILVEEGVQLSALQEALLEAEDGLSIWRSSMEIRLETDAPPGFRGFRVRLVARGDFKNVYAYLDRVSRLKVPVTPVDLSLVEDGGLSAPPQLELRATWSSLWPDGS